MGIGEVLGWPPRRGVLLAGAAALAFLLGPPFIREMRELRSIDRQIQPFIGKDRAAIVRAWGPPMQTEKGENDSTVLYWSRLDGDRDERIWVYLNKDGKIYYYRWKTRG